MKTALRVVSIITIIVIGLGLISSVNDGSNYAILGLLMFLATPILALVYITQQPKA